MTIQEIVIKSIKKNLNSPAILKDKKSITYGMLYEKAGRIKKYLLARSIRNQVIPLLFGDRENYICSILGILFSRNIFVPFDRRHPIDRTIEYIDIASAKFIIVDSDISTEMNSRFIDAGLEVIYINDVLSNLNQTEHDVMYNESDAIYIYFTSGTTGKPKPIVGKNDSLAHFIDWEAKTFSMDGTDVFIQLTSPAFDPYLREILVPIYLGATIFIPNKSVLYSPRLLNESLRDNKVTVIHTTPSILKNMLSVGDRNYEYIKYIFLAGEMLEANLIQRWQSQFEHDTTIVNLYGPTETTLAKFYYVIPKNFNGSKVPVGKPITNTTFSVINEDDFNCNNGNVGEIVIETEYASHGYLNDSSNNCFDINPNTHRPCYRTGDMGYVMDGYLYLIGRKDNQYKIGGVRIDLEEIKVRIKDYANNEIQDCVVIYQSGALIAFYLSNTDVDQVELIKYLKMYLMPIHVPRYFVKVDSIPLTLNGKVDKNKLLNGESNL